MDERILILTSTRKDSESSFKLLEGANFHPYICDNFDELIENIHHGVGAVLLSKEVLNPVSLIRLKENLEQQDSWSDLSVIILASVGDLSQGKSNTVSVLKTLRSVTILERPVRIATLLSVLESALANRKRQYKVFELVRELVHARRDAEIAKEESDRANRAKSEFLANMSHEIRTPLGVILGFTELAADENISSDDRKKFLSSAQRNGQLLLTLVNDILDLSKVESGRMAIENIEASIEDILQDVVIGLRKSIVNRETEIILDVEKDFPKIVKTDPTRIRQIFMNIIGNSVKFTNKGSISLSLSSKKIDETRLRVSLIVSDTGIGISEQQRAKLFQAFTQADSSMTRQFGGTGLGLVLSKQLARALGGDLTLVGSIPGVGSKFEISVVVEHDFAASALQKNLPSNESAQQHYKDIEGLRVLLAEDSVDNQFIISRILNRVGIDVELAKNGIEVVEKALVGDYDLILMDVQMPLLDGNEATVKLRSEGYRKPIIALTANALKGDKERALQIGFDDYITKPIQREELFESLQKFVN